MATTWMVGMDVFHHWEYLDVLESAIGGLIIGVISWVALGLWQQQQKMIRERFELMLEVAHHVANPVQILMNRDHLPSDQREKLEEEAITELIRVCQDDIPKLGSDSAINFSPYGLDH